MNSKLWIKTICTANILTLSWIQRITMSHHPHNICWSLKKISLSTSLVEMSASCCFVEMYLSLMSPDLLKDVWTLLQKWWYLIATCFVQGVNFNDFAIEIAERLSSWTVIQKSVIGSGRRKMQLTFLTRFWIRIVFWRAWDGNVFRLSSQ